MEAEKLKVIAEGMGYKCRKSINSHSVILEDGGLWVTPKDDRCINSYAPLTNAEQCMEIMEKLALEGIVEIDKSSFVDQTVIAYDSDDYHSKTLNEAVVLAAYEYFKENKQ